MKLSYQFNVNKIESTTHFGHVLDVDFDQGSSSQWHDKRAPENIKKRSQNFKFSFKKPLPYSKNIIDNILTFMTFCTLRSHRKYFLKS